jgi:hypothetical protein
MPAAVHEANLRIAGFSSLTPPERFEAMSAEHMREFGLWLLDDHPRRPVPEVLIALFKAQLPAVYCRIDIAHGLLGVGREIASEMYWPCDPDPETWAVIEWARAEWNYWRYYRALASADMDRAKALTWAAQCEREIQRAVCWLEWQMRKRIA